MIKMLFSPVGCISFCFWWVNFGILLAIDELGLETGEVMVSSA